MITEISIAVIAAAFVFLVIYLIVLISSLCKTLRHADSVLIDARTQINEIGPQMKEKIQAFDPMFRAISNVGEVLENKSTVLKCRVAAQTLQEQARSNYIKAIAESSNDTYIRERSGSYVEDILELATLGLCLWKKIKNGR